MATCFGKEVLRQVPKPSFTIGFPQLRKLVGDRAVLRAIHFYEETISGVLRQVEALRAGDFDLFKTLVMNPSLLLSIFQNVFSTSYPGEQGVSVTLALCERLLKSRGGAWRVHGGGFAGTVQTFVPMDYVETFREKMDAVLGEGSCHLLSIRPVGGTQVL